MTKRSTAPARALAVLALIGGFIVLFVVVSAALTGRRLRQRPPGRLGNRASQKTKARQGGAARPTSIENGDTLTAIAHETGVPVATDRTAQSPKSTRRA